MSEVSGLFRVVLDLVLAWLLSALGDEAQLDLVINGLHPKLSPFEVVDDGDLTDVKLRDRVRYKPTPSNEEGQHRRFVFEARRDGAAATLRYGRAFTGDAMVWMRVAVDELDGLMGPEGRGFFHTFGSCVPSGGARGGDPAVTVGASWNPAIEGFTAGAAVDGTPAGTPIDFPGQKEIFLLGERVGGVTSLYAAEALSDAFDGFGELQLLHSVAGEGAPGAATLEVGAANLGKGARLYVSQVTIRIVPGQAAFTGAAETSLLETLTTGLLQVDVVDTLLFFPTPHDLDLVLGSLQGARQDLDAALALIEQSREGGTFLPETPLDTIEKWLLRSDMSLDKAIAKAEKLAAQEASSALPLKKVVNKAQTGFRIALGQLLGFKTQSLGKLNRAVDLD